MDTIMLRNLLYSAAFLLAVGVIVTSLAYHWEPNIPNESVLAPIVVLAGLVIAAYLQRFGTVHISQLHRRIGGRLTLWFTGLLTTGFMLGAGIMWGLLYKLPH